MLGFGADKRRERREPQFDSHPEEVLDIRLNAEDRAGGRMRGARGEDVFAVEPDVRGRRRERAEPRLDDARAEEVSEHPDMGRRRGNGGRGNSGGGRGRGRGGSGRGNGGGRRRRGVFGSLVRVAIALCLIGFIGVAGLVGYEATKLPPIHSLEIPPRPPGVRILDAEGGMFAMRGEGAGGGVQIENLPPYLPKAFVAIEDRRFYSHFGVDPMGLVRAAVANLRAGDVVQGGSTLTQQLAKNLFLTPERSFERKIQEAILSVWLEAKFSKDEILEIYLNRVYFGAGAYGVEAASQRYFGKPASHVTLAEAAILAGLVKAPSRLAPTRDPEAAEARGQLVLTAMAEEGFVSEAAAANAISVPASVAPHRSEGSAGYVADFVVDQLDDLIGKVEEDIVVETTVDPILQAEAEQALTGGLADSGEKLGVSQGALVSLDPTGAVKAMVGGRSYARSQYNRAVTARRQPGSSFKPFVYLAAVEDGYTPDSVVEDGPLNLKGWNPTNFDKKYRGAVTLESALAQSLNTVAVRLALEAGPQAVVDIAHRLGITSPLQANPSIALGTSEVSVLELAGAYTPFANGGTGVMPHVVTRVTTEDGSRVLYQRAGTGLGQVISPEAVGMMNAMMTKTLEVGTARRAEIGGWPAAGKTGTSQDFRDAWFAGFTAHLVTVVWLGNDDNSPTKRASGSNLPVDIWSRYMSAAHSGVPVAALPGDWSPTQMADAPMGGPGPGYGNGDSAWAEAQRQSGGGRQQQLPEPIQAPIRFLRGLFGG